MQRLLFSYVHFNSVVLADQVFFNDQEILKILDTAIVVMARNDFKMGAQEVLQQSGCGELLLSAIRDKVTFGELTQPPHVYWTMFTNALFTFTLDALNFIKAYQGSGYRTVGAVRLQHYGEVQFEPVKSTAVLHF